jgi:hypothetical protein
VLSQISQAFCLDCSGVLRAFARVGGSGVNSTFPTFELLSARSKQQDKDAWRAVREKLATCSEYTPTKEERTYPLRVMSGAKTLN